MDTLELISYDGLVTNRARLIQLQCETREGDPEVASSIDDLLSLSEPYPISRPLHKQKTQNYHFTARCWRGL